MVLSSNSTVDKKVSMEGETETEVEEPPEGMEWWGGGGLDVQCKKEKTAFNPRGGNKKEWLAWYMQKEEDLS